MDIALFLKAYAGGLLIGTAAAGLMLFNGRIAGISGITATLLKLAPANAAWQWGFVGGLVLAGVLWQVMSGNALAIELVATPLWLIPGGLLVGFGTRLGSGCTSGHGVCGIGRLSVRSVTATVTFILCGVLTVAMLRLAGVIV